MMLTPVVQQILHHYSADGLGIVTDTETSGRHMVPSLGCKVNAPIQTV